eukprot:SM000098S25075  [mRNA]  locus=s98:28781:29360:- [translate_table: standard]
MARRAVRRKANGAGTAVRTSNRKSASTARGALARKEKGGITAPIVQRRRLKREEEKDGEDEAEKGEALEEEEEEAAEGGKSVDVDGSAEAGGMDGETEYERRRRETWRATPPSLEWRPLRSSLPLLPVGPKIATPAWW